MPDLGSIGWSMDSFTSVVVAPWLPLVTTLESDVNAFFPDLIPIRAVSYLAQVADPSPTSGFALLCVAPGVVRFERPVDAGTTVTVSVQVRKNSLYTTTLGQSDGQIGARTTTMLPYLHLTRADRITATDVMNDVTDTWDTLTATMPILVDGVLEILLIHMGTGGNSLCLPRSELDARTTGPRCWWADLTATAA